MRRVTVKMSDLLVSVAPPTEISTDYQSMDTIVSPSDSDEQVVAAGASL